MSHFVDTMAYRGQLPWHGLGTLVEGDWINSHALMKAAGLGWEAVKVPVSFDRGRYLQGSTVSDFQMVPGQFTILRSDTAESLGCTVGAQYECFQNAELIALGDALCATGEARWETAGSLKGGRLIWGLAQVDGSIEVSRRDGSIDKHGSYLLLNNTHDGTSHLRAMFTDIRVVCANTNGFALGRNAVANRAARKRGEESDEMEVLARSFTSRHTSGIHDRAAEAAEALGIAIEARAEHAGTYQDLADTPMDAPSFATFCAQLLTDLDDPTEAVEKVVEVSTKGGRSATILDTKGTELQRLFADCEAGNRGEDRYDALNAVTDFIDHQRNRMAEHRRVSERLGIAEKSFASSQFGSGAQVKRRAMALLTR